MYLRSLITTRRVLESVCPKILENQKPLWWISLASLLKTTCPKHPPESSPENYTNIFVPQFCNKGPTAKATTSFVVSVFV